MFERYTERSQQVVVAAEEGARELRHGYLGTEHILLGLFKDRETMACRVLEEEFGLTHAKVHDRIVAIAGRGEEFTSGQIPFTPRAKKVLELALREALSLGHNYIGTEHILLGLVREDAGVAARILLDFDADEHRLRIAVIRSIQGSGVPDELIGLSDREGLQRRLLDAEAALNAAHYTLNAARDTLNAARDTLNEAHKEYDVACNARQDARQALAQHESAELDALRRS